MEKKTRWIDCADEMPPLELDVLLLGAESGPKARPFDEGWARSLRDQCTAAGVPFFLKQIRRPNCYGDPNSGTGLVKMPELDGRVWDQLPKP